MSLLSFGENVTIHVVATNAQETEVRRESASRIFLNFINGGANKKKRPKPEDCIRNEASATKSSISAGYSAIATEF